MVKLAIVKVKGSAIQIRPVCHSLPPANTLAAAEITSAKTHLFSCMRRRQHYTRPFNNTIHHSTTFLRDHCHTDMCFFTNAPPPFTMGGREDWIYITSVQEKEFTTRLATVNWDMMITERGTRLFLNRNAPPTLWGSCHPTTFGRRGACLGDRR